jgi:preprotein translocase subunit SecA
VRAKALFVRDREYVVKNDEVVIVDEFTGRLQPGRRWSEGLHQAIEAKEGVRVQQESRTMASITFQNYFKLYKKLSGMTGTAETSSEEFLKIYGLDVIPVPSHRPSARIDQNDLIFQTEVGKFTAIARKVKEVHEKGQPVLIGTVSIEKNELLSAFLAREGIPHEVLNAKNHEREGEIIAQSGRRGSVVIATNMAGRGVDIKLGGNPSTPEEYEAVKAAGGLFVMGTERHDARRIDNQLRGRSGRQGDPGETQFYVSLEDSLMRIFASDAIKSMMGRFGIPEDEPIENRMITKSLENAQEKIEGFHFDARKHTLQYDDVLNKQRQSIYEKRRRALFRDDAYITELLESLNELSETISETIKEKEEKYSKEAFHHIIANTVLQIIDTLWMDLLDQMEHMRNSVNLRAYGQRDPLVEYKKEGLRMFKDMEARIKSDLVMFIENIDGVMATLAGGVEQTNAIPSLTADSGDEKIGRNDPCPCGSGKKWKKCGELNTQEHQTLMSAK